MKELYKEYRKRKRKFHDKNGNVLTVKTPDNITTTYGYDNLNRQTAVSRPGVDENNNPADITTTAIYNWEGKPVLTTDAEGNVTNYSYNRRGFLEKVTDAKGNVTASYYDRAGRKTAEVAPGDFDPAKSREQMNRVEYIYDNMDRLKVKKYVGKEKRTDTTDVELVQKAYQYDNKGNVIKELDGLGYEAGTGTAIDSKISTGYGTAYTYNQANKVVTILDPVSKDRGLTCSTRYSYDALGREVSETNAIGVITNYYYDDAGNVTSVKVKKNSGAAEQTVKSSTYDFIGNVLTQTDANGNTTTFEYNALGKVRKAVYPWDASIPQNTVICQYDVMGRLKYRTGSSTGQTPKAQ